MAWVGLERNGYLEDAQRLAYRFLYMWVSRSLHYGYAHSKSMQDDYGLR